MRIVPRVQLVLLEQSQFLGMACVRSVILAATLPVLVACVSLAQTLSMRIVPRVQLVLLEQIRMAQPLARASHAILGTIRLKAALV